MQVIKFISLVFLLFSLSSCSQKELIPSDYVTWINDESNGLLKQKTIDPLTIELLYKPIAYVIANEKRTNEISRKAYEARRKELEGLIYFTLKISTREGDITSYGVTTKAQQDERLSYLSFVMKNDIKLQIDDEELPCKLFHFERSYDLSAHRTFVLAFESKEAHKNKDKTLILDLAYFQTGPIKLNYKIADLEAIPNLKLVD